jgi:hypothetical protein
MQQKFIGSLFLLVLLSGCADKFLDVSYETYRLPAENYRELSSLAVFLDQKLPTTFRDEIEDALDSCKPFKTKTFTVETIDFKKLARENPKEYFEKFIKSQPKAQQANGILIISLAHQKLDSQLERSTAFRHFDGDEYTWFPNHAIPTDDQYGYANRDEMGPTKKTGKKSIFIRNHLFQYKINFVLYNRVLGRLLTRDRLLQRSFLSNYSRKPALKKRTVEKSILEGFAATIQHRICSGDTIKQQIYRHPGDSAAAKLVNEGFELIEDKRWPLAATKWKNALLKDSDDPIAHHNLGVFHEKSGAPLKAAQHFAKVGNKMKKVILKRRAADFFETYQTFPAREDLLAQIVFMTPGHWVYLNALDQDLKADQTYSVYRIEAVRDRKLNQIGTYLREVGLITMQKKAGRFWLGRLRQATVDYPVRPGDFIVP